MAITDYQPEKLRKTNPLYRELLEKTKEEAGIVVLPEDLKYAHTMHRQASDSDWVDVYFEVEKWEGEPHNAEPEKSEAFAWLDMNNLPDNIVPPFRAALEAIERGETYSEYGWDQ